MFTAYDARNAKRNADARRFAKSEAAALAAAARADEVAAILAANPEIGVLVRRGAPVYYVCRNGAIVEASTPEALI